MSHHGIVDATWCISDCHLHSSTYTFNNAHLDYIHVCSTDIGKATLIVSSSGDQWNFYQWWCVPKPPLCFNVSSHWCFTDLALCFDHWFFYQWWCFTTWSFCHDHWCLTSDDVSSDCFSVWCIGSFTNEMLQKAVSLIIGFFYQWWCFKKPHL